MFQPMRLLSNLYVLVRSKLCALEHSLYADIICLNVVVCGSLFENNFPYHIYITPSSKTLGLVWALEKESYF